MPKKKAKAGQPVERYAIHERVILRDIAHPFSNAVFSAIAPGTPGTVTDVDLEDETLTYLVRFDEARQEDESWNTEWWVSGLQLAPQASDHQVALSKALGLG